MLAPFRIAHLVAALALAVRSSAEVRVVGPTGGAYPTIQAAVDAALPGDLIVVQPATYAGFAIDAKPLDVVTYRGEPVTVQGTVTVRNLPAGTHVMLADLHATGAAHVGASVAQPGLRLLGNLGAVRVQGSTFVGGKGRPNGSQHTPGAPGARVDGSLDVSFAGCALRGGEGGGEDTTYYDARGGAGGAGLACATSAVALDGGSLEGGRGGNAGWVGGTGGHGASVESWGLFAAGTSFRGGQGGEAWDWAPAHGGTGGAGLYLAANSGARLLHVATIGGAGGFCWLCQVHWGAAGADQEGPGNFIPVAGQARVARTSAIGDASLPLLIAVEGAPGDRVYVVGGRTPAFRFKWGWHGVWLVPFPAPIALEPLGTVGTSGSVELSFALPPLAAGDSQDRWLLQVVVLSAQGEAFVASPLTVARLSCAQLAPDCDGDGLWDACTLGLGLDADCDGDAVPDGCEPDCNQNGVNDACDLAGGASVDQNGNGTPDECEPQAVVWHVDASAPPGGDGSAASPFSHPEQAFAVAISGHEVVLADGTYSGFPAAGLAFGGRDLVVRSANGPQACVIDLADAGRAFRLEAFESSAARIEGLTIRDGFGATGAGGALRAVNASPTIRGCVFESNRASTQGGALYLQGSSARIEGCSFVGNSLSGGVFGTGGALYAINSSPTLVGCDFVANLANALHLHVNSGANHALTVVGCRFVGNVDASEDGGALEVHAGPWTTVRIVGSLFADNVAQRGAAIDANCTLEVVGCTIVRNQASIVGGGIRRDAWSSALTPSSAVIRNTTLWDNTAPSGAQLAVVTTNGTVSVDSCDVEGGQAGVPVAAGATLAWAPTNLDLDPAFVAPSGPDGNPATWEDNDWRLALASPCVDRGANALAAADHADQDGDGNALEPSPFDLDLAPRFADVPQAPDLGSGTPPLVDLGCYERQP